MLEKAGVQVGIFGEKEICCGSPAIRIGDRETFFDLVKRNMETFKKAGVKKIITHCAGCHHVLKYDFPEVPGMPKSTMEICMFPRCWQSLLPTVPSNLPGRCP